MSQYQTTVIAREFNEKGFRAQLRRLRGTLNRLCKNTIAARYTLKTAMDSKFTNYLYTTFDLQIGEPVNFAICGDKNAQTTREWILCKIKQE